MGGKVTAPLILGIDPSSCLGWTVLDCGTGKHIRGGVVDLRPIVKAHGWGRALCVLDLALREDMLTLRVGAIALESVTFSRNTDAAHCYGRIVGTIERLADAHFRLLGATTEDRIRRINVQTAKALAACGQSKGRQRKELMVAAARERWGDDLPDLTLAGGLADHCDARWIAECAALEFGYGKRDWRNG